MATITLNINGKQQAVDVDPKTPVLWILREHLNLVGTKYGCGIAHVVHAPSTWTVTVRSVRCQFSRCKQKDHHYRRVI